MPLQIQTFVLGDWQTNCYVVRPDGASTCWIIDAGDAPGALIDHVRRHRLEPAQIVLTHAHLDHIAGLPDLHQAWPDAPILIHRAEAAFLTDPQLNLSALIGAPVVAPRATQLLEGGEVLEVGLSRFQVRPTPGHSPGGVSLYHADAAVVFAGDALFAGSVGRTDFPTSDPEALLRSIREQLLTLPDATRVYPGHGPPTTIGHERQTNPFL